MQDDDMLRFLVALGEAVSERAREVLRDIPVAERTRVHSEAPSDVIYQLDHEVEQMVCAFMREVSTGVELVAEGVGETEITRWGEGEPEPVWKVLMDPVDGTRGLMFEKRSAWFLAGAARWRGGGERLADIDVSVMVEIPTGRSRVLDVISAIRGKGVKRETIDIVSGDRTEMPIQPSQSGTIAHGFAQVSRFFHPGKNVLAELEEAFFRRLFPGDERLHVFDDQYTSSGGQLAELLLGRDRFVADLRARMQASLGGNGHMCHPYDLAAHGIARECGVIITDGFGRPLDGAMDTTTPMDWIGYANARLRESLEPVFLDVVAEHF